MNQSSISVRPLTVEDLGQVSSIHILAFDDRAFSRMGEETVRRYYNWLLLGPHKALALGAYKADQLIGFCFSGVFHHALSGFLKKNRYFLIRYVLFHPWLLFNPLILNRVKLALRFLYYRLRPQARKISNPSSEPQGKYFSILAIATHPEHWGSGVGRLLMQHSEEFALQLNFSTIRLAVDTTNTRAIEFYERQGWKKELVNNEWKGLMVKSLTSTTAT